MTDGPEQEGLMAAIRGTSLKPARERLNALTDSSDPRTAVREMDPLELYDLVHEVGLSDAIDVAVLASAHQIQTFVDLDSWRRDQFVPRKLEEWLALMLQKSDADFTEVWEQLDPEVLPMYLKEQISVWLPDEDGEPPPVPDEEERPLVRSPDAAYWIQYPTDEDAARLCRALVDKVYAVVGIKAGWLMLESTRWELASNLEETAYRFRTARLEDFGFRPYTEALEILAPLDAREVRKEARAGKTPLVSRVSRPVPGFFLRPAAESQTLREGFFAQTLTLVPADSAPVLETQLVTVGNMAASAIGIEPSDRHALQRLFDFTVGVVNIGLEFVSEGNLEEAAQALMTVPLRRIFRAGYGILNRLQVRAREMIERGNLSIVDDQPASLLSPAHQDLLAGLVAPRPFRSLETAAPFRSHEEVEEAARGIAAIAFREVFFYGLLRVSRGELVEIAYRESLNMPPIDVDFENLFATLALRAHVTGEPDLEPLELGQVPTDVETIEAAFAVWDESRLLASSAAIPAAMVRQSRELVNASKARVLDELPNLAQPVDPRFVRSVLISCPADPSADEA